MTDDGKISKWASPAPVPQQIRWALDYIITSYDESKLKSHRENLRDSVKRWILENCEQDENGNYTLYFDNPVLIESKSYSALSCQRRVSEFINETTAFDIVDKYKVRDRCVKKVITEELDFDELYALNQEGTISDEDIDSILEFTEYYALMKVE